MTTIPPCEHLPGIDTVLLDVGGTIVREADPSTSLDDLRAEALPGAPDALRRLARRYRLGLVSDTSVLRAADVRRLLEPLGIPEVLDTVVTSVDVGAHKPDPASLREAIECLGTTAERVLYIGDRPADEEAARRAGTEFAYVDRGIDDALERWLGTRTGSFATARAAVLPVDAAAAAAAADRHARLTKPPGSLGEIEVLGARLSAIARTCPPPLPSPAAVAIFAADHGVARSGVTPWPQEVTAQMVANFAAGGAAINALARQVDAAVHVVDVGVATDLPALDGVRRARIAPGTADLSTGPAMAVAEAVAALDVGAGVATDLVSDGARILVTGEMGIGNTTASAALTAHFTGRPAAAVTGRGTGIDDARLATKTAIVDAAVARTRAWHDPISALAEVGGLEIAALAGFVVAGAAAGVPVVVDGVIAGAAALVAAALAPDATAYCIAGHRSTEPGAAAVLEHLDLRPVLDLDLRLGEGTGACLALPVVQGAARVLREMATFDEAAVSRAD